MTEEWYETWGPQTRNLGEAYDLAMAEVAKLREENKRNAGEADRQAKLAIELNAELVKLHKDYDALQQVKKDALDENARLREENADFERVAHQRNDEIDRLREENEALYKDLAKFHPGRTLKETT